LIVVGDVNSTLACALVASKISFDAKGTRPLIAHVEAGLRSFDRDMPEEINRILTDHVADLLFITEESGLRNLRQEGVPDAKVHFVGNTMIDSLLAFKEQANGSDILDRLSLRSRHGQNGSANGTDRYALLTLHRPSNVDQPATFLNILKGLEDLSSSCPVIFPAHPRTQKKIAEFGFNQFFSVKDGTQGKMQSSSGGTNGSIRMIDPLGYLDFLCLMSHATIVITDSGGIQEETTCLGVPCVTVRENTERPVTVTCGTNVIAGTNSGNIRAAVKDQISGRKPGRVPEKWDGKAAGRIVQAIVNEFGRRNTVHNSLEESRAEAMASRSGSS